MTLIFTIAVLVGFIFHFIASLPVSFNAKAVAWGSWLVAAVLWSVGRVGA